MTQRPALEVPGLDAQLGSLDHPLRRTVDAFEVAGRRGEARGTADGIEVVRLGRAPAVRDLRVRWTGGEGAAAESVQAMQVLESPLGVERRQADGLIERLVVSRDAPVAWVEWTAPIDASPGTLELRWRIPGPASWERDVRTLWVTHGADGRQVVCFLSLEPETLEVAEGPDGLTVRAHAPLPSGGLRMAVVGIGEDDDPARLLRIAGRPQVAVRGREGAAHRVLAEGFRVSSPDPALDAAVARTVVRCDATRLHGEWSEAMAGEALARLAAGDFEAVREFLGTVARAAGDSGADATDRSALHFLHLVARYLAWSGDLNGTRALWPAVERVAGGIGEASLQAAAFAALDEAAEEIGAAPLGAEPVAAGPMAADGASPAEAGPEVGRAEEAWGLSVDDPVATLVLVRLRADPYAPRGRLALRPRLPAEWSHLEVRGLAVGSAAVDLFYGREAGVHGFRVEQTRGATPLQLVLAPELAGEGRVTARVDGAPAKLDATPAAGRVRVPVQIVLDRPRRLEVEFDPESL